VNADYSLLPELPFARLPLESVCPLSIHTNTNANANTKTIVLRARTAAAAARNAGVAASLLLFDSRRNSLSWKQDLGLTFDLRPFDCFVYSAACRELDALFSDACLLNFAVLVARPVGLPASCLVVASRIAASSCLFRFSMFACCQAKLPLASDCKKLWAR
jgi:hypothetical protein